MYYALIADIIDSKKLNNRSDVQKDIEEMLGLLNDCFKKSNVSKLTLTLGDEFQGLFNEPEAILLIIDILDTYFANKYDTDFHLRYGIGFGEIYTDINADISLGADGPAYWNAREAIRYVHGNNDSKNTNVCFRIGENDNDVNNFSRLQDAIRNNWTKTQSEFMYRIFQKYKYDGFEPADVVADFEMTPQIVSNRLKSTLTRQYIDVRKSMLRLIEGVI